MEEEHYCIITWPDSQKIMEEEWFEEEALLINDAKGVEKYGVSAYFIPINRAYPIDPDFDTTKYNIPKQSNMKDYIIVIGLILFILFSFGFVLPQTISAQSDAMVAFGLLYFVLTLPFYYYGIVYIINLIKKKDL